MSVLSITFHCPESELQRWENYIEESLYLMIENLMEVEKYIFSEVQSEYVNEGKNYNLLLIFDEERLRLEFVENEMKNLRERIEKEFGNHIMIFETFLNKKKSRI